MPIDFSQLTPLFVLMGAVIVVFGAITVLSDSATLNGIKARRVGDGQHGTARWATDKEIKEAYLCLYFQANQ